MKQILINLVKNALKFTRNGRIKIISAFEIESNMLKFHVVDNGLGIRREDFDKLFSMYGKLRRTDEINSEGIGMGLMICEKLVM